MTGGITTIPKALLGKISDSVFRALRLDASTHAMVAIDVPHYETHEADDYFLHEVTDLTINQYLDVQISTADSATRPHMTIEFDTEAETEWWLYKDVSINTAGTDWPGRNRDDGSDNTPLASVAGIVNANLAAADADTDTTGSEVVTLAHGICGAGKQRAGSSSSRQEIILRRNTQYSLRFLAVAAGYINVFLDWYEHEAKD